MFGRLDTKILLIVIIRLASLFFMMDSYTDKSHVKNIYYHRITNIFSLDYVQSDQD